MTDIPIIYSPEKSSSLTLTPTDKSKINVKPQNVKEESPLKTDPPIQEPSKLTYNKISQDVQNYYDNEIESSDMSNYIDDTYYSKNLFKPGVYNTSSNGIRHSTFVTQLETPNNFEATIKDGKLEIPSGNVDPYTRLPSITYSYSGVKEVGTLDDGKTVVYSGIRDSSVIDPSNSDPTYSRYAANNKGSQVLLVKKDGKYIEVSTSNGKISDVSELSKSLDTTANSEKANKTVENIMGIFKYGSKEETSSFNKFVDTTLLFLNQPTYLARKAGENVVEYLKSPENNSDEEIPEIGKDNRQLNTLYKMIKNSDHPIDDVNQLVFFVTGKQISDLTPEEQKTLPQILATGGIGATPVDGIKSEYKATVMSDVSVGIEQNISLYTDPTFTNNHFKFFDGKNYNLSTEDGRQSYKQDALNKASIYYDNHSKIKESEQIGLASTYDDILTNQQLIVTGNRITKEALEVLKRRDDQLYATLPPEVQDERVTSSSEYSNSLVTSASNVINFEKVSKKGQAFPILSSKPAIYETALATLKYSLAPELIVCKTDPLVSVLGQDPCAATAIASGINNVLRRQNINAQSAEGQALVNELFDLYVGSIQLSSIEHVNQRYLNREDDSLRPMSYVESSDPDSYSGFLLGSSSVAILAPGIIQSDGGQDIIDVGNVHNIVMKMFDLDGRDSNSAFVKSPDIQAIDNSIGEKFLQQMNTNPTAKDFVINGVKASMADLTNYAQLADGTDISSQYRQYSLILQNFNTNKIPFSGETLEIPLPKSGKSIPVSELMVTEGKDGNLPVTMALQYTANNNSNFITKPFDSITTCSVDGLSTARISTDSQLAGFNLDFANCAIAAGITRDFVDKKLTSPNPQDNTIRSWNIAQQHITDGKAHLNGNTFESSLILPPQMFAKIAVNENFTSSIDEDKTFSKVIGENSPLAKAGFTVDKFNELMRSLETTNQELDNQIISALAKSKDPTISNWLSNQGGDKLALNKIKCLLASGVVSSFFKPTSNGEVEYNHDPKRFMQSVKAAASPQNVESLVHSLNNNMYQVNYLMGKLNSNVMPTSVVNIAGVNSEVSNLYSSSVSAFLSLENIHIAVRARIKDARLIGAEPDPNDIQADQYINNIKKGQYHEYMNDKIMPALLSSLMNDNSMDSNYWNGLYGRQTSSFDVKSNQNYAVKINTINPKIDENGKSTFQLGKFSTFGNFFQANSISLAGNQYAFYDAKYRRKGQNLDSTISDRYSEVRNGEYVQSALLSPAQDSNSLFYSVDNNRISSEAVAKAEEAKQRAAEAKKLLSNHKKK